MYILFMASSQLTTIPPKEVSIAFQPDAKKITKKRKRHETTFYGDENEPKKQKIKEEDEQEEIYESSPNNLLEITNLISTISKTITITTFSYQTKEFKLQFSCEPKKDTNVQTIKNEK